MKNYGLTYHDGVEVAMKEIEADSFFPNPDEVKFYRDDANGNREVIFSIDRGRYISCELLDPPEKNIMDIIPAVDFKEIPSGRTTKYGEGMLEAVIAIGKDEVATVVVHKSVLDL